MATAPERLRPLHNFTLPRLKWGNQRFLRCMKANNANVDIRRSLATEAESGGWDRRRAATKGIKRGYSESFKRSSSSPLKPISDGGGDSNGIEEVREKLMFDLRVAANRTKVSILEEKEYEESARPWNLRTRRSACKAPNDSGGGGKGATMRTEERQHRNNCNLSPLGSENPMTSAKSSRLRSLVAAAAMTTQQSVEKIEKAPRTKFSIPLSPEEVEKDFRAMAGMRPPRRQKKRPKIVQKQVDAIFPGLWLTEMTPDTYKVPDFPES